MLIILSVFLAAPFVLLIISSFTEESTAVKYGYTFFPKMLSLDAYRYIFSNIGMFGKAFLITICVTVTGVIVSLLISSMMAYVLSRKGIPGGRILNFFVVFTMLFNGGLVATYLNYVQVFHIKNTYLALLIPNLLCNAFSIMMIKNYFQSSIPEELLEAARIDGASEMKIFLKIVIPLSKPILATVALIVGLAYWNDWQNGLYYLDNTAMHGIQNVLNDMNSNAKYLMQFGTGGATVPTTTVRMAIAVVGILPVLCVYPFFQDYFAKGITAGAVKG
jgi:putative aldouronate transport system permease protein